MKIIRNILTICNFDDTIWAKGGCAITNIAQPECKETCFPTKIGSKSYRIARSVSNPTKGVDYSKSYAPSNYALQYAGIDAGSNLAVDVKTNKRSWSDGAAALPYASMNPGD